ncbi:MAG TPA: glycosyltransferase family 39 protein [Terracidiphilus sp.]|nr:glycosyltransferase family 39 protein [Terracidiphilus sp.]
MSGKFSRKQWTIAAAAVLLAILEAQLLLSVRQESQSFDESAHLYAGYSYLKRGDFGINPEHPPLVKMVAALPLLPLGLPVPPPRNIFFRGVSMVGGLQLLYSNDADALLFRARTAVTIFTLTLALLIFLAGYEMFGAGAGLFALALFVFDPNMLANGALVATDMGATCLVFAAVYAFYRYCRKPTLLRLSVCCLAAGLALAAKHSAVLLLPISVVLALTEIARRRSAGAATAETRGRQALRLAAALATISLVSIAILWAFYGFRYQARPGNLQITPPTAAYLAGLKYPAEAGIIRFFEHRKLLPEAYLYGVTDIVLLSREGRPAYLLGHLYAGGRWFYFPAVFAIKSTLGFMFLLALVVAAKKIWRFEYRRELLFLLAPPVIWFGIAMTSKLDIGLRHVFPIYPFLMVLAGGAAWMLARQSRRWAFAVALLLTFHIASSLWAFPAYLPYSNEAFGGPSNTYKVVSDANVGWETGLKALQSNLNRRHITHCWFAFDAPNDPAYYHIPCTPLPSLFSLLAGGSQGVVPEEIQGPVFIGSNELTGFDFGPEDLNPYNQFVGMHPAAILRGEILEYDGNFQVPQVSALSHFVAAVHLLRSGRRDQRSLDEAFLEAKTAAQLDPNFRPAHQMLENLYMQRKQPADALREYQAELRIYETVHPDFQKLKGPPGKPLGAP